MTISSGPAWYYDHENYNLHYSIIPFDFAPALSAADIELRDSCLQMSISGVLHNFDKEALPLKICQYKKYLATTYDDSIIDLWLNLKPS